MSETCCPLRRKLVMGILLILTEEACGVSDTELMDVTVFDPEGLQGPTVHLRFCPWCGKPRVPGSETRITEPPFEETGDD